MRLALRVLAALVLAAIIAIPAASPALRAFVDPRAGVLGVAGSAGLPAGALELEGAPGRAVVYWDEHGVPHIVAESDEAGAYAMGWVSASLRLFQMDLLRRIGSGRLAELVGEAGLDNDVFIKTIGLHYTIEETWERIKGDPRLEKLEAILEAYAAGVNDYIDYAVGRNLLPLEYRVLGLEPEPWRPQDTIAVAKVIALVLSWNDEDLVLWRLVERWGPEVVVYMDIPWWSGTATQASCGLAVRWGEASGAANAYDYTKPGGVRPAGQASTAEPAGGPRPSGEGGVLEWLRGVRGLWLSAAGLAEASNNWVVSGRASPAGAPIVANDPHLALTAPPIWLLAELRTPSFKSVGALFPGTPLIVIGRNERVAWAFTNVMGDFTDYYYYTWSEDGRYLYRGEWLEPTVRVEEVRVYNPATGSYRTVTVEVLETVHGPVLERGGERFAVRWAGLDVSFELQFFVELNNASSVREALAAQRWFHAPIQNFVVADSKGGFAYSPVGGYPLRSNTPTVSTEAGSFVNRGMLPFNGSAGEGEWAGYIKKEDLPVLYNPPLPFIVTANSKPWSGDCWGLVESEWVGWHFADGYRTARILDLLRAALEDDGSISVEEVVAAQLDWVDYGVRDYLERVLLPHAPGHPAVEKVRAWLEETGGLMDPERPEPAIALAWLAEFHSALWSHLYGSTEDVGFLRFHYAISIVEAAAAGDPGALKLIPGGSLGGAVASALERALAKLGEYFGSEDWASWRYGGIHYYSIEHPAFNALDYERLPAGGGPYTVNVARPDAFTEGEGMPVRSGPSIRCVSDLSGPSFMISLPGGQHGNPLSPHYQDIYLDYWSKGGYLEYSVAGDPAVLAVAALEIEPVEGGG